MTASIIPEILSSTAIVYVLSSASAGIAPAAEITVVLNSVPNTTVLAGTMIGNISSYLPAPTCTVVVPLKPSSICSQANLTVRHGL